VLLSGSLEELWQEVMFSSSLPVREKAENGLRQLCDFSGFIWMCILNL